MQDGSPLLIIIVSLDQELILLPFSDLLLSRRRFLNQLGFVSLAGSLPFRQMLASDKASASSPKSVPLGVVRNRAPLAPNAFYFLPLGSIRPAGWLKNQLQIQANGLGGHLDETWADVGPDSGWLGGTGESWERGPYFLDGLAPLAWSLKDDRLKAKAQRFIDWTLDHQAPNGMIGPASNNDWWPRYVMLKALIQYQELTGDARVIPLMDKYFRYQLTELPTRPLRDWGRFRWQDEVLSVLWLYRRSGEPYLLDLAQLLRKQGYDWIAEFQNFPYTEPVTRDLLKIN